MGGETVIVTNPGRMKREHLEMNYAVMVVALGRLMFEVNRISMIVDPDDEPPDVDLRVRFEMPEGKAYITMVPGGEHEAQDDEVAIDVGDGLTQYKNEAGDDIIEVDGLMSLGKLDHHDLVAQLGVALCTLSKLMAITKTNKVIVDQEDYGKFGLGVQLTADPVAGTMEALRRYK